tara:strand:- start:286 stop:630 length:345 start_codon:yes stop_codon:yes gene_type:complete
MTATFMAIDLPIPIRLSSSKKFHLIVSIRTIERVVISRNCRPDLLSNGPICFFSDKSLMAANKRAPPAPKAAAGVGLVTPPKMDPKTATIKTTGGTTTLITSISISRGTEVLRP